MSEPTPPDQGEPGEPDAEPDAPAARSLGARRLDPMRVAAAQADDRPQRIEPVIDTRRYQWMVGIVGITLIVLFSAYLFVKNGVTTPGVQAGQRMHNFVAPLATSGIDKPANAAPRCNPAKPNLKALNVCGQRPLVLAFFVTGSSQCVREVDALQRVSSEFPGVQFAALAVGGKLKATEKLVRRNHWTIPVGVDSDGRVGEIYGIEICPLVEIARTGGTVANRLIGNGWANPARLASQVRVLTEPAALGK